MNEVMEPRIEELNEKILVGKRMDMCFAELKTYDLWHSFMPIKHLITNQVGMEMYSVEVYKRRFFEEYDDRAMFQKWAAVEVADLGDVPEVFETQIVPKGMYAVFTHKGNYKKAPETYHYIFHEWLPSADVELDDRPHLAVMGEKYKGDGDNSEEEIWIPIRII
jgi:AraC family transcriptional regulator